MNRKIFGLILLCAFLSLAWVPTTDRAVSLVTIVNTTLTNADTEYDITLPADVRRIAFQARTSAAVKCAFTDAASGSVYITVKAGSSFEEKNIYYSGTNLSCQSPTAGTVLETVYWRE